MAVVAGGGESGRRVVRIKSGFEVAGVAGIAFRRHRLKLACSRALVAGIAIHCRVCPGKRKTVVVLLDLRDRNLPAAHRVALLAVGAQSPAVNVCVTVLTSLSDIREDRLDVTLDASYRRVHAAQRILRLIVIEFRNRTNRLPCGRCMAILTRDVQISVGTVRAFIGLPQNASRNSGKRQQQYKNELTCAPSPKH